MPYLYRILMSSLILLFALPATPASAQEEGGEEAPELPDTIAYWRFEPAHTPVDPLPHTDFASNNQAAVLDASGNNNHLYIFSEFAQPRIIRSNLPGDAIPATGAANERAVYIPTIEDTRHFQDLFASSPFSRPSAANDISRPFWDTWTIEFSCAPSSVRELQCVLGYDAEVMIGGENVPVFASRIEEGYLRVYAVDAEGNAVMAQSAYRIGSGRWTNVAIVFDGEQMTMYIRRSSREGYVASDPVPLPGGLFGTRSDSPEAYGPLWTVGRGHLNGQNAHPYIGYVDEVRFSRVALEPGAFLFADPDEEEAE